MTDQTEPENQAEALTSPEAVKELIGMVRAEAASWREPQDYEPRDAVEEAAFLVANTLEALASLPEAPAVPVVKALEWKDIRGDGSLVAFPDIGLAYIASDKAWGHRNYPDQHPVDGGIEAAKAGAQADFEARIRSALLSSPPVKVDGAMIDRARKIIAAGIEIDPHLGPLISDSVVRRALEAALASQPADEGEAVAYVDVTGNVSIPEGSPLGDMVRALPKPPVGKACLPLYASPRPAAADAGVREALREVRDRFNVEYSEDGRVLSVAHDSEALRKVVATLDASLSLAAKQEQAR